MIVWDSYLHQRNMRLVSLFDDLGQHLAVLCYIARMKLNAIATPALVVAHEVQASFLVPLA